MTFTRLAYIVAGVASIFGGLSALLGLGIVTGVLERAPDALLVGKPFSIGRMIDLGVEMFVVGIALGTLAEISFNVRLGKEISDDSK